jgi:hypothetical protein
VRDEPGISVGGFVVELQLEPAPAGLRALGPVEIERLRATKRIVCERARDLFELRRAMPPPEMHVSPE